MTFALSTSLAPASQRRIGKLVPCDPRCGVSDFRVKAELVDWLERRAP